MDKYRTIVNPEKTSKLQAGDKSYYYISVDVARKGVNTSVQIFKVLPQETRFLKKLVNSLTFHDMHFQLQAIELKKYLGVSDDIITKIKVQEINLELQYCKVRQYAKEIFDLAKYLGKKIIITLTKINIIWNNQ